MKMETATFHYDRIPLKVVLLTLIDFVIAGAPRSPVLCVNGVLTNKGIHLW